MGYWDSGTEGVRCGVAGWPESITVVLGMQGGSLVAVNLEGIPGLFHILEMRVDNLGFVVGSLGMGLVAYEVVGLVVDGEMDHAFLDTVVCFQA